MTPGDEAKAFASRQEEILGFLREFWRRHGYGPSMREIGRAVGGLSTSVVLYHVERMEARGLVRREAKTARSLRVTEVNDER